LALQRSKKNKNNAYRFSPSQIWVQEEKVEGEESDGVEATANVKKDFAFVAAGRYHTFGKNT